MQQLPNILISAARKEQRLGLKSFALGENYAVTGTRGVNSRRQNWTWSWNDITEAQAKTLEDFFIALDGDIVLWTPIGETQDRKFIVIGDTYNINYPEDQHDNASFQIRVGETFRNS